MRSLQLQYPPNEPLWRRAGHERRRLKRTFLYFDPALLLSALIVGVLLTTFFWNAITVSDRATTPPTSGVER